MKTEKLISRKNQKGLSNAKAIIINIGIDKLGIEGSYLARKLGLSKSRVSKLNRLGEMLVGKEQKILKEVLGK